ncbi:MAG: 3D domain-containing protein [Candidatus Moraniibacteriota bacterium]
MIFRKDFLFVAVAIAIFANMHTAQAMGTEIVLPSVTAYDFKSDPFLFNWNFIVQNKQIETAVVAPLSFEDKTLNRWKQKQAHLWAALPKAKFTINASAYTAAADECGKSDGITASGLKVAEKRTLACPPAFPFGTKISIEGVGELRCEDRGGAIKGNHFDIYVQTKTEAFAFGRRNLVAEVIE